MNRCKVLFWPVIVPLQNIFESYFHIRIFSVARDSTLVLSPNIVCSLVF